MGVLELGWITALIIGLARGGRPPFEITGYMFDPTIPLFIRLLGLYHLALPPLLIWLVWRLGYDRLAWRQWVPIGWAVIVLAYLISPPARNINWAHGPAEFRDVMPAWLWLLMLMALVATVWALTHLLIATILRRLAPEKLHPQELTGKTRKRHNADEAAE